VAATSDSLGSGGHSFEPWGCLLAQFETICIHEVGPGRGEVLDDLLAWPRPERKPRPVRAARSSVQMLRMRARPPSLWLGRLFENQARDAQYGPITGPERLWPPPPLNPEVAATAFSPGAAYLRSSKRSAFMSFAQAAAKSLTNFCLASSEA